MNKHSRTLLAHAAMLLSGAALLAGCAGNADQADAKQEMAGEAKEALQADSCDPVWGVNAANEVFRYTGNGAWAKVDGALIQISVGSRQAWGVNQAGEVYRRINHRWYQMSGAAHFQSVAVGIDDDVWGIDSSGSAWRWDPASKAWQPQSDGVFPFMQISLGNAGEVWALRTDGAIFRRVTGGWEQKPGLLSNISVGKDGTVWGVNSDGYIWQYDRPDNSWGMMPGRLKEVTVAKADEVWGVNDADQIWRWHSDTADWELMPGALRWVSVASPPLTGGGDSAELAFWEHESVDEFASCPAEDPPDPMYGRSSHVADTCDQYSEYVGGVCYERSCRAGYYNVANVCWQYCPAGSADWGAICVWPDASSVAKDTYELGTSLPHCNANEENSGGVCYANCKDGYTTVGLQCIFDLYHSDACPRFYSQKLADGAKATGPDSSMTYGFGVIGSGAVSGTYETGVVYGGDGKYGCYISTCIGADTNLKIGAYGEWSFMALPFDEMTGETGLITESAGEGVGFTHGTLVDAHQGFAGTMFAIEAGYDVLPFSVGGYDCHTLVNRYK